MSLGVARRASGWLAVICFLIIVVASLRPIALTVSIDHGDKIGHLLAYMALAFFWALAGPAKTWRLVMVFMACVVLGGLIEWIQPLVNRYGSVADAVADLFGVGAGVLLSVVAARVLSRRLPP